MRSIADFALNGASSSTDRARWSDGPDPAARERHRHGRATRRARRSPGWPARPTLAADGYQPANGASYPDSDLGKAFKDAAHLIKSPQAVAVLTIDEGDWDMHAGLGTVGKGWMHDKLADLGSSLAAFGTDLGDDLGRVTLVTMSEFGRRTSENASNGVDHGWGNAMLMFGGGVQGGQVHGTWPGLSADNLVQGDLRATTDYRAVLADVLVNRCGATLAEARTVFPGWTGTPLGTTKPAG